jgi:4-diphosphocytidyl-2-C-methyl-D-erythritol kinase
LSTLVRCYAKLNLLLKVYGKRPDGFHNLISVMQSVGLCDTLSFEATESGSIEISSSDPSVPTDSSNLVWRAVELMAFHLGRPAGGLRIRIDKTIPVMGGLGGGSADCAGTLVALNEIWNAGLELGELVKLGARLGSDVPFCLVGGTVIAKGRGEVLEPFPYGLAERTPDPGAFLIIVPPYKVETGPAYDLLDKGREALKADPVDLDELYNAFRETWMKAISEGDFPIFFFNDFELPVLGARPELARAHDHLRNFAGHALMSGSGSCMFAYFGRLEDAFEAQSGYEPLEGETAITVIPVQRGVVLEG